MNAEKKRSKQVVNVEKARSPRIWVPERRKRTFTSENERGKNAFSHYCKKWAKVQISYSKKRQSQIFEGRYLREARAPRAGTVRPDFGKMILQTMHASATSVRVFLFIFRALNARGNLVALKTPKNAQIFVRGPARPHARPHAPAAQNLKSGRYLGYTAPPLPPATGKPTRPIADPKQLSQKRPKSGGSTTHNYLIPAPIIGHTPATRSGIPLGRSHS